MLNYLTVDEKIGTNFPFDMILSSLLSRHNSIFLEVMYTENIILNAIFQCPKAPVSNYVLFTLKTNHDLL